MAAIHLKEFVHQCTICYLCLHGFVKDVRAGKTEAFMKRLQSFFADTPVDCEGKEQPARKRSIRLPARSRTVTGPVLFHIRADDLP